MIRADGELSVRTKSVGGRVAPRVTARPTGWLHGAHRVVLLVHGYNNNQCEACEAFRSFLDNLPSGLGRVGRFFWPGDADFGFLQWLDFLSYPSEIPDARNSASSLAMFLASVARANPALELVLVGHSLGCRLILEMLDLFAAGSVNPRPNVKLILLMAAAVPVELAQAGRRLRRAGAMAKERLVLFSPHDGVLRLAFPAGQTLARSMGYETEVYLEAVGLFGNPLDFASETPRQAFGNGHGEYWNDPSAAASLARKLGIAMPHKLLDRGLMEREAPAPRAVAERIQPVRLSVGSDWSVCGRCSHAPPARRRVYG